MNLKHTKNVLATQLRVVEQMNFMKFPGNTIKSESLAFLILGYFLCEEVPTPSLLLGIYFFQNEDQFLY